MSAKERPILFSAPMVRAILEGRKTQTRRVVKCNHPIAGLSTTDEWNARRADPRMAKCAFTPDRGYALLQSDYGSTFALPCPYGQPGDRLWVRETWMEDHTAPMGIDCRLPVLYRATCLNHPDERWRPSIHMPRWASRIDLEVTGVRVERLQDISERDATADGGYSPITRDCKVPKFRELWESINGPGSWNANPWVWVVELKRVKP